MSTIDSATWLKPLNEPRIFDETAQQANAYVFTCIHFGAAVVIQHTYSLHDAVYCGSRMESWRRAGTSEGERGGEPMASFFVSIPLKAARLIALEWSFMSQGWTTVEDDCTSVRCKRVLYSVWC